LNLGRRKRNLPSGHLTSAVVTGNFSTSHMRAKLPLEPIGRDQAATATRIRVSRYESLVVRRQIKQPVVIDYADADAVEPAEAPEQILIDPLIGEKIHHRFEVQA